MKRILINATHNEEIRVALCKGNHMYDFDLENRTREQKKANIYKAHVTRVEPSLEAVFVEYGADRQGFLPIREIAKEYLAGNPRNENIRDIIKEGDTLIVQVEKEERGNKGAALSTYISLAGRYLVLMPNNPRGGGISRQISGKQREEMKRIVSNLQMPKGMSVIIRTAGIGKSQEDLQHDLDHLLNIWSAIGEQNRNYSSPRLVHQEAGVVTRAVRDYLRDDIAEIWVDNENAYNEAAYFIQSVMPKQLDKLRKYTDYEPMFARFGIEKQIETAYQREVRLPSGGSIVIDQTEAMVAIDINSAKSTKGSDVAETAYHTNLEAAEEIARQLRLRDMGGLVVIDFIDMYDSQHQKDVEKRLVESTKFDRARVQFGTISKFGLMEMSRQRLRPSLEESTGYKCPRCHGTGMIRDLRSLSLSIMRQIEQIALSQRQGELQAEVPTDIAAFLLNEKRDSLVYLEQDSGTRITILPHAHMESPDFELHFNPDGFAPSSYERINDSEEQQTNNRGYEVNWQTADNERPEHQPKRQPKNNKNDKSDTRKANKDNRHQNRGEETNHVNRDKRLNTASSEQRPQAQSQTNDRQTVAWLSNLFAPTPQAQTVEAISSQEAAKAIETIVNNGGQSLGSLGQVDMSVLSHSSQSQDAGSNELVEETSVEERQYKRRNKKYDKGRDKKDRRNNKKNHKKLDPRHDKNTESQKTEKPRREPNSRRESRGEYPRSETLQLNQAEQALESKQSQEQRQVTNESRPNKSGDNKDRNRGRDKSREERHQRSNRQERAEKSQKVTNPTEVNLHVSRSNANQSEQEVVHLSLDQSKPVQMKKMEQSKSSVQKSSVELEPQRKQSNIAQKKTAASDVIDVIKTSANETQSEKIGKVSSKESSLPVTETVEMKSNAAKSSEVAPVAVTLLREDGRAHNDPRVVREQLAKKFAEQFAFSNKSVVEAEEQTSKPRVVSSKIVGNVGEFLRTTLENAEERIEKEGVIACFIEAIAKRDAMPNSTNTVNSEATVDANDATAQSIENELSKFDFSNYGYQSLSPEYLAQFYAMTTPGNQFDVTDGKTEVVVKPIGKRASNDPRGQHPSFVEINATQQDTVGNQVAEVQQTDAVIDVAEVVEESVKTVDAGLIESNDSVETTVVNETLQTQETLDECEETLNDVREDKQADEFADAFGRMLDETTETEVVTDTGNSDAVDVAESTDDNAEEKGKTTFDKYKTMLANVSEQLSGQTGTNSLFLSTPAVPKNRSRKKNND